MFGAQAHDRSRARQLLGHHASTLLIGAIVGVVVVGLVPPPGVLGLAVPLLLIGTVVGTWVMMRSHDRRLCEQCAAAMPLDAAAKAQRLHRRFWMTHTGLEPRFLIPYMAVLIGSNFATSPAGRALWAIVQLSMIYLVLSARTHRLLQPWCPWCSGGGGGEEVDETPPVLPHDDRLNA